MIEIDFLELKKRVPAKKDLNPAHCGLSNYTLAKATDMFRRCPDDDDEMDEVLPPPPLHEDDSHMSDRPILPNADPVLRMEDLASFIDPELLETLDLDDFPIIDKPDSEEMDRVVDYSQEFKDEDYGYLSEGQ